MRRLSHVLLGTIAVFALGLGALAIARYESTYADDFMTTDHRDPVATTAVWDTGTGEIRLAPFGGPQLVGGYDTPGSVMETAVAGDHLYVADFSSGIQVLDIADPASPTLAGTCATSGASYAVAVAGDHLCVANYYGFLDVLDISDPTDPVLVADEAVSGNPCDVVVAGDVAYLACTYGGVASVDISDPGLPVSLDQFVTAHMAVSLAVHGDLLLVADRAAGLTVLDISDPAAIAAVGAAATTGEAWDVAVAGDLAYVGTTEGIEVVDIEKPALPAVISGYATPSTVLGIGLSGDFVYAGCGNDGLIAVDVSDPGSPVLLDEYAPLADARRLSLAGEHAFVACTSAGVKVIKVCEATQPAENGDCELPGMVECLAVAGDLAFVSGNSTGLQVVDISDPTHPMVVGEAGGTSFVYAAVVEGDRLYLADVLGGLLVYDIGDPTSPALLGSCDPAGLPRSLAVAGDVAFLGQYASLEFIDISDPAAPVVLTSRATPPVMDLWAGGDLLVAATDGEGLRIYDVGNPSAPLPLGTYEGFGEASGLAVAGDLALLAMNIGDLDVVDISDPSNPVLIGEGSLSGGVYDVDLAGALAYVVITGRGLAAFDIGDPTNPTLVAYNDAGVRTQRLAVEGDHAYVAADTDGFRVFSAFQRSYDHGHCYAQSLELDGEDLTVVAARLTTTETGQILWDLSADGGAAWQDFAPDGAWHWFTTTGTDLVWRATLQLPSPQAPATAMGLAVDWLYDCPIVRSIEDVPGDQGLQVRIRWSHSGLDFVGLPGQIAQYAVYRRVDGLVAKGDARLPSGLDPVAREHALLMAVEGWDYVVSVPARAQELYSVVVPTLADSTDQGTVWSAFVVSALTATPGIFHDSPPDSGYSIDNLAPNVPEGLTVAYAVAGNELAWLEAEDEDFRYFKIYRGTTPDFVPDPEDPVHVTTGTAWMDLDGGFDVFYRIAAVDFAGNESEACAPIRLTGAEAVPASFALRQNVPNPFNPRTTIAFELEAPAAVTLRIYDVSGRLVRTLLDRAPHAAGRHEAVWDGTGDQGRRLAAGAYLYRIEAGGRVETRRMVMVR